MPARPLFAESGVLKGVVRLGSVEQQRLCLVGAYCSHAILTKEIGRYRCPFGVCFRKLESQK